MSHQVWGLRVHAVRLRQSQRPHSTVNCELKYPKTFPRVTYLMFIRNFHSCPSATLKIPSHFTTKVDGNSKAIPGISKHNMMKLAAMAMNSRCLPVKSLRWLRVYVLSDILMELQSSVLDTDQQHLVDYRPPTGEYPAGIMLERDDTSKGYSLGPVRIASPTERGDKIRSLLPVQRILTQDSGK